MAVLTPFDAAAVNRLRPGVHSDVSAALEDSRVSQTISYARPDGKTCSGYYTEPAEGASAPGVVVIQEWWGVNEQIRGVAERLKAAGYRVVVPDLYRGKVGLEVKEAEHLMNGLDFADAATQDIRGAVQYLKQTSPKVGVTGFCMGGALTVLSTVFVPEADAAVIWYGVPPLDYVDATKIKVPVQGHFAIDDAFFPIAQADALAEKLQQAGVTHEFFKYQAQHAFGNEMLGDVPIPAKYDADAAETAWRRTMAFFKQHLG
jgi:carboxymethylenebutenolidase